MEDTTAKREGYSLQNDELVQEVKRVKSEDKGGGEKAPETSEAENVLSAFTATKVLKDSAREKSIFIHGKVRTLGSWCQIVRLFALVCVIISMKTDKHFFNSLAIRRLWSSWSRLPSERTRWGSSSPSPN